MEAKAFLRTPESHTQVCIVLDLIRNTVEEASAILSTTRKQASRCA
jgi:hypothetical protein